MEILEEGIRARNRGALVRLEMSSGADEDLIEVLTTHLKLDIDDIYEYHNIPINLGTLWYIVSQESLVNLKPFPKLIPKDLPPI